MIKLGKKYKDKVTGIEGIATAVTEYEFGCRRIVLEKLGKDENKNQIIMEYTFDEQRLVPKTKSKTKRPGGPGGSIPSMRSVPTRR